MSESRHAFVPVEDARPQDVPWPELRWPISIGTHLVGAHVEMTIADPQRDAAPLFGALDHDAVWRHVAGRPRTPHEWAQRLHAAFEVGRIPWLMRLTRPVAGHLTGAVVGTSSYLEISAPDARLEIGSTALTPAVWGGTVNPESKLLLLTHAFDELGAGRVQLKTDVRNERSQRAIAGIGASFEGTLRRYQRRTDGTMRDTVLFSVTADRWPDVRALLRTRLASAG